MPADDLDRGWFPERELTGDIIGAFFYVYNRLRYGFLESVYARALETVLIRRGHRVAREVRVPVWFDGQIIGHHRIDMLVDGKVIVENKASERLHPSASRQLLSYLRATTVEVGLLLHFGPKAEYRRIVSRNGRTATNTDPPDP